MSRGPRKRRLKLFPRQGYIMLIVGILIGFLVFSAISFMFPRGGSENGQGGLPSSIEFEFRGCQHMGRIFNLVRRLAVRYQKDAGIDRPPVPADLITHGGDNRPIEIQELSFKAHHGAIWRLSDCWVIQLNSNDTAARKRFTLYHEIFHILAHSKVDNEYKKLFYPRKGYFNELLADYFSASILMPREHLETQWSAVRDIAQVADLFNVPNSIGSLTLTHAGLI